MSQAVHIGRDHGLATCVSTRVDGGLYRSLFSDRPASGGGRGGVCSPTATSARTSATSAGAIGWTSSGAIRRAPISLGPGRQHLGEVVEMRRRDDAPRHRASLDELLLRSLAEAMGVAGELREADDRQQHVVLAPPACCSAASRLRVERLKNSTASSWSDASELDASITASTPVNAVASPSPVYTSTPWARLIPTVSWSLRSSASTLRRPMRPVAPTTATRMLALIVRILKTRQ